MRPQRDRRTSLLFSCGHKLLGHLGRYGVRLREQCICKFAGERTEDRVLPLINSLAITFAELNFWDSAKDCVDGGQRIRSITREVKAHKLDFMSDLGCSQGLRAGLDCCS